MWLTERLNESGGVRLCSGYVDREGAFAVQGDRKYEAPEQLFPYGFASAAESGRQAVMLDGYCAGVTGGQEAGLEEGEVRLYSAGGAEIWLKSDGSVVINGQVFAKG